MLLEPIDQYEDQLLIELDVLWKDCPMDAMLNCREIFIRAAAAIASQKWVSIAVANELYRTRKLRLSKVIIPITVGRILTSDCDRY